MKVEPTARGEDVRSVLAELPDWFGIPSANEAYAEAAGRLPGLTVRVEDAVAGVALLDTPFPSTTDIHLLAVRPSLHRRGLGRALVEAAADTARQRGSSLLSVRTVGPSFADEGYARTREFYAGVGFVPVVELQDVDWNGPTLVSVRRL